MSYMEADRKSATSDSFIIGLNNLLSTQYFRGLKLAKIHVDIGWD